MSDDQILRELLRYPHEEIRAWELANPDRAKPAAPPEWPKHEAGTRVRVTTKHRPSVDTGEVLAERWGQHGGCLVRHNDGAVYGWAWSELEPVTETECLTPSATP